MKPIKTTLLFLLIFLALFILSVFFPENGIQLSENIKLTFPKTSEIFDNTSSVYKDISSITSNLNDENFESRDFFSQLYNYPDEFDQIDFDLITLYPTQKKDITKQKPKQSSEKKRNRPVKTYPLEFSNNNKSVLYPFFESLHTLKSSNKLIRILHYGDSQIEGDRITSYIRNELQKKFGGSGIGMFPVVVLSEYILSVKHEISNNWKRYTMYDIKNAIIDHNKMGIMLGFCRFSPPELLNNKEIFESYIKIEKSDISYNLARKFNKCRLFYGFNRKPLVVEIYKNNELHDAEILLPNDQLRVDEWNFDEAGSDLTIKFKGEDSPNIYAIALDNTKGVAVDNIPLRGSKGLDFTNTDLSFLKEMYYKLNVKLIILQFGVNLVPIMAKDYTFYEEQLYEQLVKLEEIHPDIPIIVVGISDMSKNNKGRYETFPQIKKIRQAQKNATFKAGCVFWDTYNAMGGENSMPSWVFHDPPLARKDFTHFTYTGSKLIAKMFYNSLMKEYYDYINSSN